MKECSILLSKKRKITYYTKYGTRFFFLLLLFFFMQPYHMLAQEKKVSVDFNNTKLEEAISQLEAKSGYHFLYNSTLINAERRVNAVLNNASVNEVLNAILKGTDIKYKVDDTQVVLYLNSASEVVNSEADVTREPISQEMATSSTSKASRQHKYTITGNVTSAEDGQPLEFISVIVKGSQQYTTTDINGNYSISTDSDNGVLVFSLVGFISHEEPIGKRGIVNVLLSPETNMLDNAVVIGYGRTTQRLNTGAVSTVNSKAISDQAAAEPLGAMQGRVSGLFISSTDGSPGGGYKVQLRGVNSLDKVGSDPLYIVDGVPFISETISQLTGSNGRQSPLSMLNPTDIERIDVLKDADATAIYGSRGANGVILITTKSGRSGKTKIDFDMYSGISYAASKVDMLSPSQYYEMREEAFKNDGVTPNASLAPDLFEWDRNKNTDWQDYLIGGTANLTEAKLSMSGGSEQTTFLVSGTYRYEEYVTRANSDYKRGAVHANINHRSKDNRFLFTLAANYSSDSDNANPSGVGQYYNVAPNMPIYNNDGSLYWYELSLNPVALFKQKYNSKSNNLIGNVTLRYSIIEGLDAKINLGYTRTTMDQLQTFPEPSFNPLSSTGNMARYGNSNSFSYIAEPQLSYTKDIWNGKLTALLGATWQHSEGQGNFIEGKGYSNDNLLENMMSASSLTVSKSSYQLYKYQSVFARLNYAWREKYLLNLTYRRDGSSRFGPGNKFGDFGSVGAAWILSNEPFLKEAVSFMNFAKLRASYGVTGNDQIGNYQYLDSWKSNKYPYEGITGLSPTRLSNDTYGWEENKKFEVGLELGFFESRILLKTDYYLNRSDNLLIGFSLSPQTGFTNYTANLPALVENTGFEFDLNGTVIRNQAITWESSLNLTIPKNKLLEYPDLENSSYVNKYVIGQPVNIVKGFRFIGVNPQTGIAEFYDKDNDGKISEPNDHVILGSEMPKFYGGLFNSFRYKNLELSFLFQFVKQDGPSINYGYMANPNGARYNSTTEALDRWRQPGDITSVPRATATSLNEAYKSYTSHYRLSDAVWGDASYIRLKNLMLSYDLTNLVQRFKISSLSVYFQAQNLFTITNYIGFDPETQGTALPPLRMFSVGIRISL